MTNRRAKGKDEILIEIDQRIANQKDPTQMATEVMPPEMIEGTKMFQMRTKGTLQKGLYSRECPYVLRGGSRGKRKYEAESKANNAQSNPKKTNLRKYRGGLGRS